MTGAGCSKLDVLPALHDGTSLTDREIEQLLLEAEDRLRCPDINIREGSKSVEIPAKLPQTSNLSGGSVVEPYVRAQADLALVDTGKLLPHAVANALQTPQSSRLAESTKYKTKPTAGKDWFNLPKTELTAELRRDLQLLRMRSVLDPKRHYKKENGKSQIPTYSQIGTVVEGPTEFFSGRIAKRDRKKTFVDEALAIEKESKRFEANYRNIQSAKQSGKKAFYKNLRSKRNFRGK
ncbi:Fcf2 domain-containing protein [Aspergillus homomorphus CBS 101889]|uniref:Nucleolus protein required for cell viability n=1 Tax=Aspergillus homomorphus (strain CBS 101889) TaxID=1450537 RepID=A0A395HKD7_ASPHC|nr:nucleolus protein required for cell viability [Aspergillus homomorphus CBS 101889]RAL08402.1 nucleolus protein required for cell viability [Aspergillus homomorphus CBS 101889]